MNTCFECKRPAAAFNRQLAKWVCAGNQDCALSITGMAGKHAGTMSWQCRNNQHTNCFKLSCPCECGHPLSKERA